MCDSRLFPPIVDAAAPVRTAAAETRTTAGETGPV